MSIMDWMGTADPVAILKLHCNNGWLRTHFPELHRLYAVPQRLEHHPEGDVGTHVELVLERACELGAAPRVKFACMVHDLGKALTPEDTWPKHPKHEDLGLVPLAFVTERFGLPADWVHLAAKVVEHHLRAHRIFDSSPRGIARFYRELACAPDERRDFLLACQADAQGRLGMREKPYPQAAYIEEMFAALDTVVREPGERVDVWAGRQVSLVKRKLRTE